MQQVVTEHRAEADQVHTAPRCKVGSTRSPGLKRLKRLKPITASLGGRPAVSGNATYQAAHAAHAGQEVDTPALPA